ncbi:MAG: hypothetical protein A4E56_00422 [Pelotomaculum sp. PtaU1.Bin065]|nr:MAG: hypothetical protein A4E56_00422 [Pelotomaculum sp. PtaU1.Bin065]
MFNKIFVIGGIIILVLFAFLIRQEFVFNAAIDASKKYITALAEGNAQKALEYSSGEAAVAATRLMDGKVAASVDIFLCEIVSYGNDWGKAAAGVRLTLSDGTEDIGWYSMDVIKNRQGWKVISLKETVPVLSGQGLFISQNDVSQGQKIITGYLEALTLNDLEGAKNFLAGQAKRQHEISTSVLGKAPLIKTYGNVQLRGVWEKDGLLVCRAEYHVDDREVISIVTLAEVKTGQWRIINIQQVGT